MVESSILEEIDHPVSFRRPLPGSVPFVTADSAVANARISRA
jgi:hypothetical protein